MPAFCSHYALEDIAELSRRDDLGEDTPVLRATSDARTAGYDAVCVPLTNEKWKARWTELCILDPEESPDKLVIEQRAEAWRSKPAFFRDEVTISRLGECLLLPCRFAPLLLIPCHLLRGGGDSDPAHLGLAGARHVGRLGSP